MEPWKILCEVFDYMPLACLIDGEIFCIHGGLSPQIKQIDQIRLIERKQEIPLVRLSRNPANFFFFGGVTGTTQMAKRHAFQLFFTKGWQPADTSPPALLFGCWQQQSGLPNLGALGPSFTLYIPPNSAGQRFKLFSFNFLLAIFLCIHYALTRRVL